MSAVAKHTEIAGPAGPLFYGLPLQSTVWMSHGDDLATLPDQFLAVGHSDSGVIEAIVHRERPLVGLQFHPEVAHTEHGLALCGRDL